MSKIFKKRIVPIQKNTIRIGDEVIDNFYKERWGLGKVVESKINNITVKFPPPKGDVKYQRLSAIKNLDVVYSAN